MKLTALHDTVILRKLELEEASPGGIIYTDYTRSKKSPEAVVVAAGPGRLTGKGVTVPTGLKEGDVVIYNNHAGRDVTIRGEKLILCKADDVEAVEECG